MLPTMLHLRHQLRRVPALTARAQRQIRVSSYLLQPLRDLNMPPTEVTRVMQQHKQLQV